jgi:hypothetical protein
MFGIKRLRRENALLRESLDWYASSVNWRRRAAHAKGESVKWIKSPAAFDRGARAKFTLTQLQWQPLAAFWRVSVPAAINTPDKD